MRAPATMAALGATLALSCVEASGPRSTEGPHAYRDDLNLLRNHLDVVELTDTSGRARVAVVAAYQGRVMTSTTAGPEGWSLGWINRELIASGRTLEHINPYGGEDRFWLGPEGGQFALFFEKDTPFDLEDWQTPALIDTEPFEQVAADAGEVTFRRQASLRNRAGFTFELKIERVVRLLGADRVKARLGIDVPATVGLVAFETENRVTNAGAQPWRKETGLLSIWILGMFPPSPGARVVIPFEEGSEDERGPVVNDAYFGEVPADRLVVGSGVLLFRADGRYRSKIGIPPPRARPVCGSYDPERGVLTLVQFTLPEGATDYVNSMWEIQEQPFSGDVVNSYNDGPPSPGAKPLGPFYELESSSPALALAPGESHVHVHRTIHLQGDEKLLDPIARDVLGVGIAQINGAFDE